ncbi:unnamed protein product [Closterium sp. Yama58-4]|nr:unnamed protein product [Closterium sp. Yama58-4]
MAARRALFFSEGSTVERPQWLDCLLKGDFFSSCTRHVSLKKNEMNLFCLDCMEELCQHCMPSHQSHKMLQVRPLYCRICIFHGEFKRIAKFEEVLGQMDYIESNRPYHKQTDSKNSFFSFVQIRRYVYHDVVRLQDITKLVDCSGVQAYIVNGSKVVFLNQRPQPRPTKTTNSCLTCARMLQDEFSYCCLGCKVRL